MSQTFKLPCLGKAVTGTRAALEKLHKRVLAKLAELLRLSNLGAKRVKALYDELGIKDLEQLGEAERGGRLSALPGFGVKT